MFLFLFIFILFFPSYTYSYTPSLSLEEAILLAVRNHPNIQSARLSYLTQKFNLQVQAWQFRPHYGLELSGKRSSDAFQYSLQGSTSLFTPFGTQISLTGSETGLSSQIMQPLLRGFGKAVVEAALNNAKDNEVIARLNIENTLRNIITNIIYAYLNIISVEQSILIDEKSLKRAEEAILQTKLFIQAGRKAGNEIVTVEANRATANANLENDKTNLQQAIYNLLAAIGLDPLQSVRFSNVELSQLVNKYDLINKKLDKKTVIRLGLSSDIQYQIDQMTLAGPMRRALFLAKDNTRWQLNLIANANILGKMQSANHIALTMQVPIDDQIAKQAVFNAKIAIKQARLALLQEKWNKQIETINAWNIAENTKKTLFYAKEALLLQEKTYQINYQKYLHGLIDSLQLQSAELQLIQAEQSVLRAQIVYLKSLIHLDLLTGHTLTTWQITVRV